MSAATFSPTSKTEGLEIVPFLKRRIFISPPLMFCFKGCPVTIPCGQCKQLVKASTNNSKNSNNNPNGLFGHEDLLEQLSDHYRFNFWISESSHTDFFLHPELNRSAYCIVCRRSFPSIPRVIKHVREILLDPTMRTRKYHWLILENVTNLFVNRDIGFVETDEKLVKLLGKLFPQENHFVSWAIPSFEQIFESLRFIVDAPNGLNSDRSNSGIDGAENTEGVSRDVLDGSVVSTPRSDENLVGEEVVARSGNSSFRSTDLGFELNNAEQLQLLAANSATGISGQDDQGILSELTETMRRDSDEEDLQQSMEAESVETDYLTSNESDSDQGREEIEVSFVSHRQRVTRWVSMRPIVFPSTNEIHSTPRNSDADQENRTNLNQLSTFAVQSTGEETGNPRGVNRASGASPNIAQNAFIRRRSCRTPYQLNIEHDPTIEITVSDSLSSTCFDELNISSRSPSDCSLISGGTSKGAESDDETPVDETDTGFVADFSSMSNETYIVDKSELKVVASSRRPSRTGSMSTFTEKSSSLSSNSVDCDQPMTKARVVRVQKVSTFKQYASRSRPDTKSSYGSQSFSHHFSDDLLEIDDCNEYGDIGLSSIICSSTGGGETNLDED